MAKITGFNQRTFDEFRAKRGRGVGGWGDHLMLLTAHGARSGEAITTPLVFGRDGDDYIVVASKGGAPNDPTWYRNVQVNPEVECEVASGDGTETFRARARAVPDRAERDRLFYEVMAKIWPSFIDYEKRTERLIPVVVLERITSG
jgi:deazaflavin-dependent oxidoreductase (nitroreductase family)